MMFNYREDKYGQNVQYEFSSGRKTGWHTSKANATTAAWQMVQDKRDQEKAIEQEKEKALFWRKQMGVL